MKILPGIGAYLCPVSDTQPVNLPFIQPGYCISRPDQWGALHRASATSARPPSIESYPLVAAAGGNGARTRTGYRRISDGGGQPKALRRVARSCSSAFRTLTYPHRRISDGGGQPEALRRVERSCSSDFSHTNSVRWWCLTESCSAMAVRQSLGASWRSGSGTHSGG